MLRHISLSLLVLILFSCDSTFDTSRLDNDLEDTYWVLEKAETSEGDVIPLASASRPADIVFDSRGAEAFEVNGYNGCNAFSANYNIGGDNELQFSRIVQTERACMPDEARVEAAFNRGIHGALRYSFDGDQLVIEAPGDSVSLRFFPVLPD